jgi:hypothetical protein
VTAIGAASSDSRDGNEAIGAQVGNDGSNRIVAADHASQGWG